MGTLSFYAFFPVCGDFDFLRKNPYRGVVPCGGDFEISRKNPYRGVVVCGGDFDFSTKKTLWEVLCSVVGTLNF